MSKNIKAHVLTSALLLAAFILPAAVSADTGINNPLGTSDLPTFFAKILQVVIYLGATVVVFFFILAGFKYVTAQGNEEKVSEATRSLTWTAVGAAILLGAQTLELVISNTVQQLGVTNN